MEGKMGKLKDDKKETKEVEEMQEPIASAVEHHQTQKLLLRSIEFQNVLLKEIQHLNDETDKVKIRASFLVAFAALLLLMLVLIYIRMGNMKLY
jgi:hypothetical protein